MSSSRSALVAGALRDVASGGWGIAEDLLSTHELALARQEAERLLPSIHWAPRSADRMPAEMFTKDPAVNYLVLHEGGPAAAWQKARAARESDFLFGLAYEAGVLRAVEEYFGEPAMAGQPVVSAKFPKGGDGFEQGFHIDPLYAVYATAATPSLRMWVYLTDVSATNGATEFMPHPDDGDDLAVFSGPTADFSGYYYPCDVPDLQPQTAAAPAGSVLFYQARAHHRATGFKGDTCRVLAHYTFRAAAWSWLSVSWDHTRRGRPIRPAFDRLDLPARDALGFPPVGAPHWRHPSALAEASLIYPGLDLDPYRPV